VRWYIGSIFAMKANGENGLTLKHSASARLAASNDEALGKFFRQAHEYYPSDQGFSNHSCRLRKPPSFMRGRNEPSFWGVMGWVSSPLLTILLKSVILQS